MHILNDIFTGINDIVMRMVSKIIGSNAIREAWLVSRTERRVWCIMGYTVLYCNCHVVYYTVLCCIVAVMLCIVLCCVVQYNRVQHTCCILYCVVL